MVCVAAALCVWIDRILSLEFLENPGGQLLIDQGIRQLANVGRPGMAAWRVLPSANAVDFFVEGVGKPLRPWEEFWCYVGRQDLLKLIASADLLVARSFVNKTNDP